MLIIFNRCTVQIWRRVHYLYVRCVANTKSQDKKRASRNKRCHTAGMLRNQSQYVLAMLHFTLWKSEFITYLSVYPQEQHKYWENASAILPKMLTDDQSWHHSAPRANERTVQKWIHQTKDERAEGTRPHSFDFRVASMQKWLTFEGLYARISPSES